MRKLLIAVLPLLLAACGVVRSNQIASMDAQQVQALSDDDLCRPGTTSNPAVMAERQQRGLADCSGGHRECRAMGYTLGTPLYLQCRTMIAQREGIQEAQQQAAYRQMMVTGGQMMTGR
jgi:hypothetical protein